MQREATIQNGSLEISRERCFKPASGLKEEPIYDQILSGAIHGVSTLGLIRAVVFDLDDTLYLEQDYVCSGFRHVANALGDSCDLDPHEIFQFLWGNFNKGVRGDAFDRLVRQSHQCQRTGRLRIWCRCIGPTNPQLAFCRSCLICSDKVAQSGISLALISDGPVTSQNHKIKALGLNTRFDLLVLPDGWGAEYRKPHPRAFETTGNILGVPPEELVYIADNPLKDFQAPRQIGWSTVRLRLPGQLHEFEESGSLMAVPGEEVYSMELLENLLFRMCALPPQVRIAVPTQEPSSLACLPRRQSRYRFQHGRPKRSGDLGRLTILPIVHRHPFARQQLLSSLLCIELSNFIRSTS